MAMKITYIAHSGFCVELEKHVLLTDGLPPLDHSTIGRTLKKGGFVLT